MRTPSFGTFRRTGKGEFGSVWTGDQVPLHWSGRDIAAHTEAAWQSLFQRVGGELTTRQGLDVRNFIAALSAIGGHAALAAELADPDERRRNAAETITGACGRIYHVSEAVNATLLSMTERSFASVVVAAGMRAGAVRAPSLVQIQFQVQVAMRSRRFPDYSVDGNDRPTVNPQVLLAMFLDDVRALFGADSGGMRAASLAAGDATAHAILLHRSRCPAETLVALALETALTFAKYRGASPV